MYNTCLLLTVIYNSVIRNHFKKLHTLHTYCYQVCVYALVCITLQGLGILCCAIVMSNIRYGFNRQPIKLYLVFRIEMQIS